MRISIEILVQNQYRGGFKNIYIRSIHDDERLSIIFHRVSFHSTRILQLSHRVRDTRKLGSQVNVRNSVRILEGAGWTFSILKNFPLSLSLSNAFKYAQVYFSRKKFPLFFPYSPRFFRFRIKFHLEKDTPARIYCS